VDAERDLTAAMAPLVLSHPHVDEVQLVGSRAEGTAVALSDWDFLVRTDDFPSVASDLPELTSSLAPLAQQWDRLSTHQCYMLMLPGPAKVDLLFLEEPHEPEPPWEPGAATLPGIDRHLWDWILWLAAKEQAGKDQLVAGELRAMAGYLLDPIGAPGVPASLAAAVDAYRRARAGLESRFGVRVSRRLEREVLSVLPRS
jgi:hypothetical protein